MMEHKIMRDSMKDIKEVDASLAKEEIHQAEARENEIREREEKCQESEHSCHHCRHKE